MTTSEKELGPDENPEPGDREPKSPVPGPASEGPRPEGSGPAGEPLAVVGVGASAGGLQALQEFFGALPADTGAAFVVLQHLEPDQPSLTPDLISPRTSLAVRVAEDGTSPRPDEIVFLPPNATLRIRDGALLLEERPEAAGASSVIDTFLRSLAEDQESAAVGVLLSGSGSDGTLGLKAVKEHGGMTMVQDPESAEFAGMAWSALRAGAVDYVEPVPELAGVLADLLARRRRRPLRHAVEVPDEMISEISGVIRAQTGHSLGRYKRGTLSRRLGRRLQLLEMDDLETYMERLQDDTAEVEALFQDLLIGVTEFFRDPEAWETLAEIVIPRLFADRGVDDTVRAWVPGCATGEEAYSLAMLLQEQASETQPAPGFMVFATDIDEQALSFAREGLYPNGIADSIDPSRMRRFFAREGDHYRVNQSLREYVIFAAHNVLQDPPFSKLDLVCCRNLLIYLEPDAQEIAARIFQYSLKTEGYLLLGTSENLPAERELFDRVSDEAHRIFRRNEKAGTAPIGLMDRLPGTPQPVDALSRARTPSEKIAPGTRRRRAERMIIEDYGPAAVLVNDRGEIREFFGPTRRYLEPSSARGSANVVDMALPGLRTVLRSLLRKAMEEGREVVRQEVRPEPGETDEMVDVAVRPASELGTEPDLYLVVFRSRLAREAPADGRPRPPKEGDQARVRELEAELGDTRERLQMTIQELEASNEELQSANEELLSMNEELQTSKEEAQSVNEELQTVNAELRSKVKELDRAHSDLRNLFRSTQIATIFLDKGLRIQRFTPPATDLFRLRESDVGRSVRDITQRFDDGDLEGDVREVMETLVPRHKEVRRPQDDRWYTLRIAPYRTVEDSIEGVVLTFTDITEIKETEERLRRERGYAQSIVETVNEPLVMLGPDLSVLSAGRAFYESFGFTPEEVGGRPFLDLHPGGWNLSEEELERVRTEGEAVDGLEVAMEVEDGGRRIITLSARPVLSEEDETPLGRVLVTMQDVTERRRWEQEKMEEARRKDWFLTLLGHELRNPLAPIQNGLDLLRRTGLEGDERDRVMEMMQRQMEHLRRLVDDLLDLSRIASGEIPVDRERVDLVRLVRDAVEDRRPHLEEEGRELILELPEGPLWGRVDEARIDQVLGNLLSNARKFTDPGDRITVSVRHDPEESTAVVAVADTGAGMTEEDLSQLFEPFHRGRDREVAEERGLGIGLTLVREVARAHAGSVEAASEGPGRGAVLTLRLPLEPGREGAGEVEEHEAAPAEEADREMASRPRSTEEEQTPAASLRILVVEDSMATVATTRLMLELEGHEVETASDGESALEWARELRPDVLLCDLGLPGEMDGNDVARAVRSDPELSDVRLVAVSGYGQASDRERSLEAGFDAYLVKPVRETDLFDTLATVSRDDAPHGS